VASVAHQEEKEYLFANFIVEASFALVMAIVNPSFAVESSAAEAFIIASSVTEAS
jgi:hypothetical protein